MLLALEAVQVQAEVGYPLLEASGLGWLQGSQERDVETLVFELVLVGQLGDPSHDVGCKFLEVQGTLTFCGPAG